MNGLEKDIKIFEEYGFKVIGSWRDDYGANISYLRLEKHNKTIFVEVWCNGNYEETSDGGYPYLRFYPVIAHHLERTRSYKTIQGFVKAFDKKYKN